MIGNTVVYTAGAGTLLYSSFQAAKLIWLYARPSSLPRYLQEESYALVTGASDGIGLGFAQELLSRGFHVILHGRNSTKLSKIQAELRTQFPGKEVEIVVADASASNSDVPGIVEAIADKRITVLINNVGGSFTKYKFQRLEDNTPAEVDESINLNARFSTQLTRALLPALEHNAPSLVMSIGSTGSVVGLPLGSLYAGCKAYDMVWSNSMRLEMKLKGKDVEFLGVMFGQVHSGAFAGPTNTFVLSSRAAASAALDKVGCGEGVVWASFAHEFQSWAMCVLPQWVTDMIGVQVMTAKAEEERKQR